MRQAQVLIFNASNVSSSNGSKIDVNQAVSASFQIINGDTDLAGTIKLQFSNQICEPQTDRFNFVPTSWQDIPNTSVTITAGVPASAIVIPNMCFSYIRVVLTQTTPGSSTTQVLMNYLSI
jgi:hypothetical protein